MADYRPGLAGDWLAGIVEEDEEPIRAIFVSRDHTSAELYRMKLEVDGYRTVIASPDRLAALLRQERPDILFLDIRRRGEVLALYRELRVDPKDQLPIVLLSHCTAFELAEQHLLLRSFDFVIRPLRDYGRKSLAPFGSN